jgi:hypothetical protein
MNSLEMELQKLMVRLLWMTAFLTLKGLIRGGIQLGWIEPTMHRLALPQ